MNYQSEKKTREKTIWIIDQLVLDSGCQGLDRCARAHTHNFPHEEIVYIGDSARALQAPVLLETNS